jgi:23S rRNA (guanosine2251-2'-O)-methyltransferase
MLRYNPASIKEIVIQESAGDKKIGEIISSAARCKIATRRIGWREFNKLFDTKNKSAGISQGVVAIAEEFQYSNLDEVLNKLKDKKNVTLVILDEIQDPHNLGAIIRTSAAAEADAVVVTRKNSAKVTHTVIKTSSGAVNYIPIIQADNIYDCIMRLKSDGLTIVGTSPKSGTFLHQYHFPAHSAVVLGSEGKGLRKNIINLCDELLKIPVGGKVESLNVSVAAGVILYEMRRKRNQT